MPRAENPFQVQRFPSRAEFCDRGADLERLRTSWTTAGARLVVYGDRRLGKTAALNLVANELVASGRKAVVFSLATAVDPQDAVRRLIRAVYAVIGKSWKTMLQDIAAGVRFSVTIAPSPDASGLPQFSFGLEPGASAPRPSVFADALDVIESELERRKLTLSLGIDEFQRLLDWGGEDVEWALKAVFERHRRISYILAGSARSLIAEMVSSKGRALWKTVDTLQLGAIPPSEFVAWMVSRAHGTPAAFDEAVARRIVTLAGPRTRDIVLLAGATWDDAQRHGKADPDASQLALVRQSSDLHARVWSSRTDRERRILRLLAHDADVEPTSESVRTRFGLGPSSTVTRALGVLADDELLTRENGRYHFDDPFFRSWVAHATSGDISVLPGGPT